MSTIVAPKGLEGIVATNSAICWIDGDAGVLSYRGIDIHELAEKSTFEETTYLLWFGHLPTVAELAEFNTHLSASRHLDPKIIDLLRSLNVERGVTIISATHDHKMLDVSDRIFHIRDGQLALVETREELDATKAGA